MFKTCSVFKSRPQNKCLSFDRRFLCSKNDVISKKTCFKRNGRNIKNTVRNFKKCSCFEEYSRIHIEKISKSVLYPTLHYVLKYSRKLLVSSRRLLPWQAARGPVFKVMCFSVPHVDFWIIARAL